MFKRPTVIVLGAGASWHYGYPTGDQLVSEVLHLAQDYKVYCTGRLNAGYNIDFVPQHLATRGACTAAQFEQVWKNERALCADLIKRLQHADPPVIDYFLGWNADFHDIGRMLIAAAILKREALGAKRFNFNRKDPKVIRDNWVRLLVHQLLLECRSSEHLLDNKIRFVTFNYDTSLEFSLRKGLEANSLLKPSDIDEFLRPDRFVHMYGAITQVDTAANEYSALTANYAGPGGLDPMQTATTLVNKWGVAGNAIQVIDPDTKESNGNASHCLRRAERIFFLGFGFDQFNIERLDFSIGKSSQHGLRELYFTNFEDVRSINKKVAKVFDLQTLEASGHFKQERGMVTIEKSAHDTYRAIELDFASFLE